MNEKTLTLAASKDYRINNSKGEVIKKQSFAQSGKQEQDILFVNHNFQSITDCFQARYCSFECQGFDWARHGDYCVVVQEKIRKKMKAKKAGKDSV